MRNTIILTLIFCYLSGYAQTPMPTYQAPISKSAMSSGKVYKSYQVELYNYRPYSGKIFDTYIKRNGFYTSWNNHPREYAYSIGNQSVILTGSRISSHIYKPFSNKMPSAIHRAPMGGDDDDDDDWGYGGGGTGDNPGDPEQNPFAPIGEGWCLALFAVAFMLLRMSRKKKHSCV